MELLEQPDRRVDQHLAGALGAAGADDLVVPLGVGPARGDVADRAVGQLGDDRVGERRVLLDRQAQLDEDLAGQRDPGEVARPGRSTCTSTSIGLPLPGLDVEHLVGLDRLEEARLLAPSGPDGGRRPARAVSTSAGEIVGSGSATVSTFDAERPVGSRAQVGPGLEHRAGEDDAHPGRVLEAVLGLGPADVDVVDVAAAAGGVDASPSPGP